MLELGTVSVYLVGCQDIWETSGKPTRLLRFFFFFFYLCVMLLCILKKGTFLRVNLWQNWYLNFYNLSNYFNNSPV
jgi:hypothetical protein